MGEIKKVGNLGNLGNFRKSHFLTKYLNIKIYI